MLSSFLSLFSLWKEEDFGWPRNTWCRDLEASQADGQDIGIVGGLCPQTRLQAETMMIMNQRNGAFS
ncbi:hypothetical protein BgiBS90_024366 [Biomphalaria glabrata]|nr:hypothetical protein BgiBS90_024366 [Biomphalaria glabrata]